MTDLDELFRPLIDESMQRREPVEQIETRAREYRRRERRRHRAEGFVVGAVVIALVVGAAAVVRGGGSESAPPAISAATTTTTNAVHAPTGWQTYDYGIARISIPPDWSTSTDCPRPDTLVLVDPSIGLVAGCPVPDPGPTVQIQPLPAHTTTHLDGTVNGIRYGRISPDCPPAAHCGALIDVPALNVRIGFGNLDPSAILKTLTYSTYGRLVRGPRELTACDWKTVTYRGVSVRVPSSWNVVDLSHVGMCSPERNHVYVGTPQIPMHCGLAAEPRGSWVQLQTLPVAAPGYIGPTTTTRSRPFEVRRQPINGPLARSVDYFVTGDGGTVDITVGLGPDTATVLAIVDSIRQAR